MLLTSNDLEGKYWAADYRKWHNAEDVPPHLDRDIVSRLGYDANRGRWHKNVAWEKEYDAAAELYTRTLFEGLGLQFEFQPTIQSKTPDFLLRSPYEEIAVDVTVLHGGSTSKSAEQEDDYLRLRQNVMDIESDLFIAEVPHAEGSRSVKGRGGGPVSFKEILRPVRKWILEQEKDYRENPEFPPWQASRYPATICLVERFEFADLGIDLQFDVDLYLKIEETYKQRKIRQHLYKGDVGVSAPFIGDTKQRLERALKKKIAYLKGFGQPHIVIVFSSSSFDFDFDKEEAKEEAEEVLYGNSIGYDIDGCSVPFDSLIAWEERSGQGLCSYSEGIFTSDKKHLLAVLVCKGHLAYPNKCEMSMWPNPYASYFAIPQSLFRLKTYTLNRQIICTPPA